MEESYRGLIYCPEFDSMNSGYPFNTWIKIDIICNKPWIWGLPNTNLECWPLRCNVQYQWTGVTVEGSAVPQQGSLPSQFENTLSLYTTKDILNYLLTSKVDSITAFDIISFHLLAPNNVT